MVLIIGNFAKGKKTFGEKPHLQLQQTMGQVATATAANCNTPNICFNLQTPNQDIQHEIKRKVANALHERRKSLTNIQPHHTATTKPSQSTNTIPPTVITSTYHQGEDDESESSTSSLEHEMPIPIKALSNSSFDELSESNQSYNPRHHRYNGNLKNIIKVCMPYRNSINHP